MEQTTKPPQGITDDQRRQMGKAGKLWRAVVYYYVGNEVKNVYMDNMTTGEMREFRANLFSIGYMLPVEPGHYVVIPPSDLGQIHIYKQKKFFEP